MIMKMQCMGMGARGAPSAAAGQGMTTPPSAPSWQSSDNDRDHERDVMSSIANNDVLANVNSDPQINLQPIRKGTYSSMHVLIDYCEACMRILK